MQLRKYQFLALAQTSKSRCIEQIRQPKAVLKTDLYTKAAKEPDFTSSSILRFVHNNPMVVSFRSQKVHSIGIHRQPGCAAVWRPCSSYWSEQATTGQRNKKLPAGRSAAFAAAAAFGLRQRARNLRGIPTAVIYQNKQRMYNKPPVHMAPTWAKDLRSKQKRLVLQATIRANAQHIIRERPTPQFKTAILDTLVEGAKLLLKPFLYFVWLQPPVLTGVTSKQACQIAASGGKFLPTPQIAALK